LKLSSDVLAVPLTWLINNIIQEGEIPQAWKKGRVLPLHKKKEKSKVENYRQHDNMAEVIAHRPKTNSRLGRMQL
jgi:hypothetical protein